MAITVMGAYHGTCPAETNLIDVFREAEKEKRADIHFSYVRKIAIEAPAKTSITINDTDIIIPSTGFFELGLDYINITNLVFHESVDVNIIYLF